MTLVRGRPILGSARSRFAVYWYNRPTLSRPRGGIVIGRLGLWWLR